MGSPHLHVALTGRFVWWRHKLSLWLFNRFGRYAAAVMVLGLLMPAWALTLAWMCGLINWAFTDGLQVSLPRFIAMMVGCAVPVELLFVGYRRLSAMIEPQEGRDLGDLARSKSSVLAPLQDSDLPGPWRPLIRIEAWMVLWAFDGTHVRQAEAAKLQCATPHADARPPTRRL